MHSGGAFIVVESISIAIEPNSTNGVHRNEKRMGDADRHR